MLASFIILFREVLEIAIILTVVIAATRSVPGRAQWIWGGIAGGVIGSAIVALFARSISEAFEGVGQEMFNAAVLIVAVAMIAWTVIWMRKHGKELAQRIHHVGHAVAKGELPLYSVALIVSLAMWREGAEIVLFMTGILSTSQESFFAIAAGALAGAVSAAALGVLLYLGIIKLSAKYFFSVTSALLILVACGMSAQAAGYLIAADMLPAIAPQVWDTSHILAESSIIGKILNALIGYSEQPSAMQLVFYVATLFLILASLKLTREKIA
ncbi:MAG: FTR1 family protein [Rickettsiales bacterium]|nr:FTR1 family protein [Rickettsiales bacterium]